MAGPSPATEEEAWEDLAASFLLFLAGGSLDEVLAKDGAGTGRSFLGTSVLFGLTTDSSSLGAVDSELFLLFLVGGGI